MRHVEDIKSLITILQTSSKFHMLIISGAPGWGKTHTVCETLSAKGTPYTLAGSYTTPLGLYNILKENSDSTIVLDDTIGLLENDISLSILKAATWSSDKTSRNISWNSTSKLVENHSIEFAGKLILITNHLPGNSHCHAIASRSLVYEIETDEDFVVSAFQNAIPSEEESHGIESKKIAAEFLCSLKPTHDISRFNLRTLELATTYASSGMPNWQELLVRSLPRPCDDDVISKLSHSGLPITEQIRSFQQLTGKSRRTFFYKRKKLVLKANHQ